MPPVADDVVRQAGGGVALEVEAVRPSFPRRSAGRAQIRGRPIAVQPSGPRKIGAVGALAKASTTAAPRSCASRSCLRSSSRKIPRPRASGRVVA